MLCLPLTAMAQEGDFNALLAKYSSKQECTTVELFKDILVSMGVEGGIDNMQAISVENCNLIAEFSDDINGVTDGMNVMMSVNTDGKTVKILSRTHADSDKIIEMIIFTRDDDKAVAVRLKGSNIELDSASSIMNF